MVKIKLYNSSVAPEQFKEFESECVARWILDYYGESAPEFPIAVFKDSACVENDITQDVKQLMSYEGDVVVLERYGYGIEIASAVLVAIQVIAAAVSIYMIATMPKPMDNINRVQESPNNSLTNRDNQFRFNQRIEDIFGKVKSIPSLIMQTYYTYIDNIKYEHGYYCVGRGYYQINEADVYEGDTRLNTLMGNKASFYAPFTSPNSGHAAQLAIGGAITDKVIATKRVPQVDGILLRSQNQVELTANSLYRFEIDGSNKGWITQWDDASPSFEQVLNIGDYVWVTGANGGYSSFTVSTTTSYSTGFHTIPLSTTDAAKYSIGDYAGITYIPNGSVDPDAIVTSTGHLVTAKTTTSITIQAGTLPTVDLNSVVKLHKLVTALDGMYQVQEVVAKRITLTVTIPIVGTMDVVCDVETRKKHETDKFLITNTEAKKLQLNLSALNGLFVDTGKGKETKSVTIEVYTQALDINSVPTGTIYTTSVTLSGKQSTEVAKTIYPTMPTTFPYGVAVWCKRTTQTDYETLGTIVDEVKWVDLYAFREITEVSHFGNITTVYTVSKASYQPTSGKSRQLNAVVTRKIPTFDGTSWSGELNADGTIKSGVLNPSSSFVDIMAAIALDRKIGALVTPSATTYQDLLRYVDYKQLYNISQTMANNYWNNGTNSVGNNKAIEFNYTFDSDNTSFEEMVVAIANAVNCTAYRQNGKIRFAFDKQDMPVTGMFTHRNKKPEGEVVTRSFKTLSDYDGIEFRYTDNVSWQQEVIRIPTDGTAVKPLKIEGTGITNFEQAWWRANREYNKIRLQRNVLTTTTTMDARNLLPNSLIRVSDNTRIKCYDGEVVGISGNVLTLSRDVVFTPSLTHYIVLMKRDGSLDSISCTAGTHPNKVVLSRAPYEAVVTDISGEGIRTIFSFAAEGFDTDHLEWLVQEIDLSDGMYAEIKAVNFNRGFYSKDRVVIPDRKTTLGIPT